MFKKIIALLTACVMLLVLVGCNESEDSDIISQTVEYITVGGEESEDTSTKENNQSKDKVTSVVSENSSTQSSSKKGTVKDKTSSISKKESKPKTTVDEVMNTETESVSQEEEIVIEGYRAKDNGQFAISKDNITFGKVAILGDSYSTYDGYIVDGNTSWYHTGGQNKEKNDVAKVEQTWWHSLISETSSQLVFNDSCSGATICNVSYNGGNSSATSFITRMENNFSGTEGLETIFIFGGTNDDWANSPVGGVMYNQWEYQSFRQILPSFCYILNELRAMYPKARIINLVNSGLDRTITNGMMEACEYYNVDCIKLQYIEKTSGHPNVEGMKQIKDQILTFFRES